MTIDIREVKGLDVFTVRDVKMVPLYAGIPMILVPALSDGIILEESDFGVKVRFYDKMTKQTMIGYVQEDISLAFVKPLRNSILSK